MIIASLPRSLRILIVNALFSVGSVSAAFAQQSVSTLPETGIINHPVQVYALTGGTITVEPGKRIESGTLVIRDGKISEIGTNVSLPAGAIRVDCTGKHLFPGFVDAGIEVEIPSPTTSSGIAHWSRDIAPERSVGLDLPGGDSSLVKLQRAGITTAVVAPRDGIIKGKSAVVSTGNLPLNEALIKSDAAMHVRLTVNRGRGRDSYPSSPMGAVALARQTFSDALWYQKAQQTYRSQLGLEKPDDNVSLQAINDHLTRSGIVVFDALNEQYALRADSFGREFGMRVVLKGSGQEYQLLSQITKTNRPIIVPVNFPKPPAVQSIDQAFDVELEELTHWELAPENPSRLLKAGAEIMLTSSGLSDPSDFLPQVRKAVARGLSKEDALAAMTTIPARLFGVDSQCGTLRRGQWANIVVADRDLFDDGCKLEEVWNRGVRPANPASSQLPLDGEWAIQLPNAKEPIDSLVLVVQDSAKKGSASLKTAVSEKKEEKTSSPDIKKDAPPNAGEKGDVPASSPTQVVPPTTTQTGDSKQPDENRSETKASNSDTEKPAEGKPAEASVSKETAESAKPTKLKNVRMESGTLAGVVDASKLSKAFQGDAHLSFTYLSPPISSNTPRLQGTIRWPDGSMGVVTASRLQSAPSSDADKKENTKEGVQDGKSDDSSKRVTGKEKEKEKKEALKILSPTFYPPGSLGKESTPTQPKVVLFRNATLWTCGPDGLLEGTDLLIREGKISEMGKSLAVPEGAVIVDASQFHLSPGLIDCHSHMATDSGINEATQAVTAEVRIGDFIDAGDITLYRQLAGGLTSANILHGSANPIGGQNQVIKLRWGMTYEELKFQNAPAGIKFALGENVKQSNWENSPRTRYPQSRMGVEQLFRDRFNAALKYTEMKKDWQANPQGLPVRVDLELEALSEILAGKRWIHCHSYRQDEILALLRVLEDYKVTIGSLQHILEGYKVADVMAKHGATASTFSDWWNYKFEVFDAIPYNGALMHEQGISVSFNSDDNELGRHMNHEAAKAVKYGNVPPMEALKFVTLNPAKQLRIDRYVGSIEIGKDADIAVWSGSPLSATSRCMQTWIDGRKFFDVQEDAELRLRDERLKNELIQRVLQSGESSAERSSLADDPSRLWPHHDEYCHDHHDEDHDHHHGEGHHHEHEGE